jgi:hypothetical protein
MWYGEAVDAGQRIFVGIGGNVERTCKTCGRTYRGLVCQACHPRGKKQDDETGDNAFLASVPIGPFPSCNDIATAKTDGAAALELPEDDKAKVA